MKEGLKFIIAAATVLLLLPCVLTALLSGRGAFAVRREADLEGYVAAYTCLAAPQAEEKEMLKAQAVLMRSQLYGQEAQGESLGQDGLKEVITQLRRRRGDPEFDRKYELCRQAVRETRDQVLVWQGEICPGAFHPVSAGTTRNGGEVLGDESCGYLKSVESGADIQSADYLSGEIFSAEELNRKLSGLLPGISLVEEQLEQIQVERQDSAGYALEVRVGEETAPGEAFAEALGLSSSCFTVQRVEDKARFLCRGRGHGLGLSQYGAEAMAREGASCREILKAYFPQVEIRSLEDV